MKKLVWLIALLVPFAGCCPDKEHEDPPIEYIKAPLLPMKNLYWRMERPEWGGSVDGYVWDEVLSGESIYGRGDAFVNSSKQRVWKLTYSTIGAYLGLQTIEHYTFSEYPNDIKDFIAEINEIFGTELVWKEGDGGKYTRIETENTAIMIRTSTWSAKISYQEL